MRLPHKKYLKYQADVFDGHLWKWSYMSPKDIGRLPIDSFAIVGIEVCCAVCETRLDPVCKDARDNHGLSGWYLKCLECGRIRNPRMSENGVQNEGEKIKNRVVSRLNNGKWNNAKDRMKDLTTKALINDGQS